MDLDIKIVTYRDVFQYEARKKGRYSDEYKTLSAQIFLDKQDMVSLGASDGQRLMVKNDKGNIVVVARISDDDAHPGLAFMISSPWSNQILADDNCYSTANHSEANATVSLTENSITRLSDILDSIKA